jgi:HK97 family phage major capsid protein
MAPLVTKNREANELRSQADALRVKLADPKTEMTVDEVNKTIEGIRSLEMRAQATAEFTPEAEIRRQGGEEEVRAFRAGAETSEETPEEQRKLLRRDRKTAAEQIRSLNDEVMGEFGSQRELLRVLNGRAIPNASQQKFIEKLDKFTRQITGDTDGGQYLLPLTQVAEIFSVTNQQPGIMQTARTYNVPGRSLRIPYLIQDTGDSTLNRPMAGQIADVTIIGEGSTKPARTPQFGQRLLTVFKFAAITQMGDEILVDDFTGELPTEVSNAVGQQAVNAVNEQCTIDGDNSGNNPLGALNSANGALIKVNRATANTFTAPDAFNMYERHTHGPKSCWMISRRVLAQLFAMQTTNNTMVTFLRDLNNRPQMLLLGLPVIISDLLSPLGTLGDVALINGDFYALALRQALTIESSIHFAFINDLTTYRFIVRAGGIPIPTSTYAYKVNSSGNKVDEHSPFVALDVPAS